MVTDKLIFDLGNVYKIIRDTSPTKMNVISLATRFFDPIGVLSPIMRFKLLFQKAGVDWDEPLTGSPLQEWNQQHEDLQIMRPIVISRPYTTNIQDVSVRLL